MKVKVQSYSLRRSDDAFGDAKTKADNATAGWVDICSEHCLPTGDIIPP